MSDGVLFVNPKAGGNGDAPLDELREAASGLGVDVRVLGPHDDLAELARTVPAGALGMAGGDGSLGAVAQAAIERGLPFVVVPWGTRNHFASDPVAAVSAFGDGVEHRVDVGRAAERVFLNNVSFGAYARLVHRREEGRRRGEALARMRALGRSLLHDRRWREELVVDDLPLRATVLLVANNEYRLDLRSLGERTRLDEGTLAVYAARGLRRLRWTERKAQRVRVDSRKHVLRAAVDGEPVVLDAPVELTVEPRALRLLLPRARG